MSGPARGVRTVLHVINTGGPGGAETVCVNLMRHLDASRWRAVAAVPDEGWIYRALVDAGVPTFVLGHPSHAQLPRYVRDLARLVKRERVSVVHSHLFGPTFTAAVLGVLGVAPVVGTIHGEGDLNSDESLRRAKFALVNRGVRRVVFVSEALREAFLAAGPMRRERTQVIPNGIDLARYGGATDPAVRRALGAGDGDFLVGAVGNLRPGKGHDVLIRAAALLRERSPRYRVAIVGHGHGDAVERELVALRDELGLGDVVRFAGFRDDVPAVMSAVDLYALTSRSEGFSISTVEAMASERPVVATRCGGPEHILSDGRTGVLVENGSAEAVADAIDALRLEPARAAALASAARIDAAERFAVRAQVRAYEDLYDQCVT